jgi:hypothetical protein
MERGELSEQHQRRPRHGSRVEVIRVGQLSSDASVNLVVLLWPFPGEDQRLIEYEDQVLPLLALHGGTLVQRLRTNVDDGAPLEIHVIRFPSNASYERYLDDPRRIELGQLRTVAVARTEVHRVVNVGDA